MADARPRRLPRRRHGPRQDGPAHRAAPAPARDRTRYRSDAGRLPDVAARQLGARVPAVRAVASRCGATTAVIGTSTTSRRRGGARDLRRRASGPGRARDRASGVSWSPTRRSTSRTRCRARPGSCARSRPRPGSRSPARRSRTGSVSCGRSSTGPPPVCSGRSRRSAARSRCRSSATATRSRPSTSPDWSARSCCAGASRIPAIAPELPAQDRDRPRRVAHRRAGHALRGGGARDARRDR